MERPAHDFIDLRHIMKHLQTARSATLMNRIIAICLVVAAAGFAGSARGPAFGRELTLADVNGADFALEKKSRAVLIKAQVLLDRAGFSPGVIDGRAGGNFINAVRAFQGQNGLKESGDLDPPTWSTLVETSAEPVLIAYAVTAEDVKGPFVAEVPDSFEKKAELKRLAYTGAAELLAERFHMDEDLLEDLNSEKAIDQSGTGIVVANVKQAPSKVEVTKVVVEKTQRSVRAFNRDGKLVGFYPASIGSDEKPAPSGTLKITRVVREPVYIYNPKFQFRDVQAQKKLKIAPGPNNPVGSVWINLNERSYGIHGTAEPAKVGKTYSHGCVRLTNWDAKALAAMVKKGTVVEFVD
jgi:lipoprotein-anchoring transpeptidase ErfK/SrfK